MIKKRKSNHYKKRGVYNEERVIAGLQKRIKRKFGFTPKPYEIRTVWRNWTDMVVDMLTKGEMVMLDKKNKIYVMGERLKEGTTAHRLMMEGKTMKGNKIVKINKINARHLGIKYKIHFEHTGRIRDDVYFEASPKLKKAVKNALHNTMVNYSIKP